MSLHSVNGKKMSFTQHEVRCAIKIQRTWRLSFRLYTTKRMIVDLAEMNTKAITAIDSG